MKFPYLVTCLFFGIICQGRSDPVTVNSNTICDWGFNETDTNEVSDPDYEDYDNDYYDVIEENYADYGCITTSESDTAKIHAVIDMLRNQPTTCELQTVFTKQSGERYNMSHFSL